VSLHHGSSQTLAHTFRRSSKPLTRQIPRSSCIILSLHTGGVAAAAAAPSISVNAKD